MGDPEKVKCVQVGKSGTGFRLSQRFKMRFKKIIFDYDVSTTSRTPLITLTTRKGSIVPGLTLVPPLVLEELKQTDTLTELRFIY